MSTDIKPDETIDPVALYRALDPSSKTTAAHGDASRRLFDSITATPRAIDNADPSTTDISTIDESRDPVVNHLSHHRLRRPRHLLITAAAAMLIIAATIAVVPFGTTSASARVTEATDSTAVLPSGTFSTEFDRYAGDERIGSSRLEYAFAGADFDLRNTFDEATIDYFADVDLRELFADELGPFDDIEIDEVSIEPETQYRSVDGVGYLLVGGAWRRGTIEGLDLTGLPNRAMAAAAQTSGLERCEGPDTVESFCGTSVDRSTIAAMLLTEPRLIAADATATVRIDINPDTSLVAAVHATLRSERERSISNVTRTEVTLTVADLVSPIVEPELPAEPNSSTGADAIYEFEVQVPGVDNTCTGAGSLTEARQQVEDCLLDSGLAAGIASAIAASLE